MSRFFGLLAAVKIKPGRCCTCLGPGAAESEFPSDLLTQRVAESVRIVLVPARLIEYSRNGRHVTQESERTGGYIAQPDPRGSWGRNLQAVVKVGQSDIWLVAPVGKQR